MTDLLDEMHGGAMAGRYDKLMAAAAAAADQAYAPHSGLRVGAAVETASGRIFAGCNVENASFGLTNCAERGAVFAAVAAGERKLVALAMTSSRDDGAPPSRFCPCGACLQVLAEFATPDLPVVVAGVGELRLADLMPQPFGL